MQCDFCSDPNILKTYPAADFVASVEFSVEADDYRIDQGSAGDWAACQTCANLIDRGAWDELTKRSVDTFFERNGDIIPRRILIKSINKLHRQFREYRKIA